MIRSDTLSTVKVSVVVTTYNREAFLKETIESILSQTFKDFELIVVDNFSNYDFFNFLEQFNDKRIKGFQNNNHGVIAINRNFGIQRAVGKYVAFCDDDDLWYQNKLEIQLKVLMNDDNLVGVGSNVSLIGKTKMSRKRTIKKDNRIDFLSAIMCNSCALSSLMVMKRKILFNTDISFNAVEDFDFQLQHLLTTGKEIIKLRQPLVYYRVHSESISSNSSILLNALNVLSKYESNVDKTHYKNAKSLVYSTAGFKLLKNDENTLSRKYLRTSFRLTKKPMQKVKTMVLILGSYFPTFLKAMLKDYYRLS